LKWTALDFFLLAGTIIPPRNFGSNYAAYVGATLMHRDFEVLKDPIFWAAMIAVIIPLVVGGAVLVWFE
jgi:hypothetical protein